MGCHGILGNSKSPVMGWCKGSKMRWVKSLALHNQNSSNVCVLPPFSNRLSSLFRAIFKALHPLAPAYTPQVISFPCSLCR